MILTTRRFVYGLVDPLDHFFYYVGLSENPSVRFATHLAEARSRKTRALPKSKWIYGLQQKGLQPLLVILEEVTVDSGNEAESRWKSHLEKMGHPLTNGAVATGPFWKLRRPSIFSQIIACLRDHPATASQISRDTGVSANLIRTLRYRAEHLPASCRDLKPRHFELLADYLGLKLVSVDAGASMS